MSLFGTPVRLHEVIDQAAERHPHGTIWLDLPLAIAPELGRTYTFPAFARLVLDASGWLFAAGVRPGDTVAIVKTNGLDVLVLGCAAERLGAMAVLILPDLEPLRCEALLARLRATLIVADRFALERGGLRGLSFSKVACKIIVVDGDGTIPGTVDLANLRGTPAPSSVHVGVDQPVLVTHTSGTTGIPKLAMHSTATLNWHLRPQVTLGRLLRIKGPIGGYIAYTHVRGFTGVLAAMRMGLSVAAASSPRPDAVRDLFTRVRPSYIETYPNVYLRWEELGRDPYGPLANVQFFFSTFDALHPRSIRNMLAASQRRLPFFVQVYGQSELGPVTMNVSTRWSAQHTDGRCVGFSIPGFTRVRLIDADNSSLKVGTGRPGRIQVRSGARCLTYAGEAERATSSTLEDGWWYTGDIGQRTRFGCVHMLDREAEWDRGLGSALRVEDALLDRLPTLTEAIVLPQSNQPPLPVLATRDDVVLDRLAWSDAVRGLPGLAHPIQLAWDDIPRTPTTKVRRGELRRRLEHHELTSLAG
jgi:acyl-coenzyme A synthetase/AMP-(fatty) acid ligase